MPKRKSNHARIVLVVVVALVIAGIGGYFVFKGQSTVPTPTQLVVPESRQLTKEDVLNGYYFCNLQFENGVIYLGWEGYEQLERTCPEAHAYIGLDAEGLVFSDFDGDGLNEALVPARVVRASSGGEMYVFKNIDGTARVVAATGFGKQNGDVVSITGNIVVIQTDGEMGYVSEKRAYKFVEGKLIPQ